MRFVAFLLDFAVIMFLIAMATAFLRTVFIRPEQKPFQIWKDEHKRLLADHFVAISNYDWDLAGKAQDKITAHNYIKPDVPFWAFWIR